MLAAITCFFNPCHWKNREHNLRMFRERFSGCPLVIIELSLDNTFVYDDSIHIQAIESNDWIWHKERLLNIAESRLPDHVTKIAWIDADIVFDNRNWAVETSKALDSFGIVQPWEHCRSLNPDYSASAVFDSLGGKGDHDLRKYHCGFAWAARREMFPIYDRSIYGGGDTVTSCWANGVEPPQNYLLDAEAAAIYRTRVEAVSCGTIGCVPGTIRHLYHGKRVNRRYSKRHKEFAELPFGFYDDIVTTENGLFGWAETVNAQVAKRWCRDYLRSRAEDN